LIKELGIDNSLGNPTYTPTTLTKDEILDNHRSVLCSFGISTKDEELDLPSLYWIPTQVPFQTALYCWVCQMLHETSFQIINIYSIGGQNRVSELHEVKENISIKIIQTRMYLHIQEIQTY
jgi:hypothetical protein